MTEKKKSKKCGRCGRILPFDEFNKYKGKRGEDKGLSKFYSYCKECAVELSLIRQVKKKFRLITEYFDAKCDECGEDLTFLPSFEFHHPYPELKTAIWDKMKFYSYNRILEWVKHDCVIPVCGNCHTKKSAKGFLNFKELILNLNMFKFSSQQIDTYINQSINRHQG